MPYTQEDIDRLRAIRAQGVKSVTFSDGRRAEYHSAAEIDAAIAMMEAEVAQSTVGRSTYASFTRE